MNNQSSKKFSQQIPGLKIAVLSSVGVILVTVGFSIWVSPDKDSNQPVFNQTISASGLHWHSDVTIYVKGVKQEIPTDIGIGAAHQPIHTHDANGTVHLEFGGLVRGKDITLGQFFKNWGKDFRSFGATVKMTVNGKENTELENYVMRDKDKIELRYE